MAAVKERTRPRRPVLDRTRRDDIQPELQAWAKRLGWNVPADWHRHRACVFVRGDEAVWMAGGGWTFARRVAGRMTDHRVHASLMDALEDRGPGVGRFMIYVEAGRLRPVTETPVGRDDPLMLALRAYACRPTWREMAVGDERAVYLRDADGWHHGHVVRRVA